MYFEAKEVRSCVVTCGGLCPRLNTVIREIVFSLASKISPSVIFVDEVDSMLGRRESPGEHEAMHKIKNKFMVNNGVKKNLTIDYV